MPNQSLRDSNSTMQTRSPSSSDMDPGETYAGLMSGTSLDGVDAVLVDFCGDSPSGETRHAHTPYPDGLKSRLQELISTGSDETAKSRDAGLELADIYAASLRRLLDNCGVKPSQVAAVGCHGQTIRHEPQRGWTVQIGDPHRLAHLSGICVVHDFRSGDMARGGQGAPFAPLFHQVLFQQDEHATAVVNIGGISNVTILPAKAENEPVRAWDTGPGGALMDAWCKRHTGKAFDEDGKWASEGTCNKNLVARMMKEPYFLACSPKSTGRELFNMDWLEPFLDKETAPADVQASLLELTACTVATGIQGENAVDRLVLCGGGTRNSALRKRIMELADGCQVVSSSQLGYPETWIEAATFAYLAKFRMNGTPIDTSSITGARPGKHLAGSVTCP